MIYVMPGLFSLFLPGSDSSAAVSGSECPDFFKDNAYVVTKPELIS